MPFQYDSHLTEKVNNCSLVIPRALAGAPFNFKGLRAKKFRATEDARHVFNEGLQSMQSFTYTGEEKLALESYAASMMHAKFVCAKDEAVCKVLKALSLGVLKGFHRKSRTSIVQFPKTIYSTKFITFLK